ncbi:MAG: UbiX family flavin prenyltransferase [Steroidobacteraceae bacterium]|jgi:4-hydroxy-3-polyprenylbenzoate decarboxylase|nr:UbiX family flavin prenyltransferase [Steroidobacteraceae bacterium]
MSMANDKRITVGMTGASGAQYGLRLVECLVRADYQVLVMFTRAAQIVVGSETDCRLPGRTAEQTRYLSSLYGARDGQLRVYGDEEWTSPVASGSGAPRRMAVCPASMATVSAIACGASENLLERAADVVIKERGNLVVVPRETPFSAIHLENMLRLSRLGVTILPANPGFYNRPTQVEALVDFIVARVLDQFGIENDLMARWGL